MHSQGVALISRCWRLIGMPALHPNAAWLDFPIDIVKKKGPARRRGHKVENLD
jgi:hypothetical protein